MTHSEKIDHPLYRSLVLRAYTWRVQSGHTHSCGVMLGSTDFTLDELATKTQDDNSDLMGTPPKNTSAKECEWTFGLHILFLSMEMLPGWVARHILWFLGMSLMKWKGWVCVVYFGTGPGGSKGKIPSITVSSICNKTEHF